MQSSQGQSNGSSTWIPLACAVVSVDAGAEDDLRFRRLPFQPRKR